MSQATFHRPATACGTCLHFEGDPSVIEGEYPGLAAMSSGFASVRADDGLCRRHDLYLSARDSCPGYKRKAASEIASMHLKDHHEKFAALYPSPAIEDDASPRSVARHRPLSQDSNRNAAVLAGVSLPPEEAVVARPKEPFWLVSLIEGIFR